MTILDQFGRPYPTRKSPERRPLATAPIRDSWREYVAAGLTPEKLASVLKAADAGDMQRQSELFDQIEEKDGHLQGEKGKRQNVVLDVEYQVKPASEDARDVKVAEFVQSYFDNMTDFEDVLVSMQDAVGKGYAGLEIGWDSSEGQALPESLEFIEQKRFVFMDGKGILRKTPLLITDDDPMGVEIPSWKVLFHRYGGKSGHPTRSGIYRVCSWMFLFKNYSVKDWVVFCERYGMPLRLGRYDQGASKDDKDALIAAISSLGSDAAGIISKSTEIDFVETVKGKASGDLFEALAKFCNAEMSKALLGQTLTAEVGDTGSYAASNTHNEVRLDLAKADTRSLTATLRDQLIRPIVGFNFGWDTPCPFYKAIWEEQEDLKEKAEWLTSLLDRHVEMPLSFVRQEFNIPKPEGNEPVLGRMSAQDVPEKKDPSKPIVAKKEVKEVEEVEDAGTLFTEQLETEAGALMDAFIEPVRNLVETAQSLEEVRDGLIDLYPDMNATEMGILMQQALTAAELSGRFEVSENK